MTIIEATFTDGAFVPTLPVEMKEGAQVELTVKPAVEKTGFEKWTGYEDWLKKTAALRQSIFDRVGFLTDSTLEVADDRRRDD